MSNDISIANNGAPEDTIDSLTNLLLDSSIPDKVRECLTTLRSIKQQYENEENQLQQQIQSMQEEIESRRQQFELSSLDKTHEENLKSIEIERHSLFSLYYNISGIKWDYNTKRITGTITKSDSVIPLSIDPSNQMKYDVVNSIWQLISKE
ncbi:hypothetical protein WA158_001122 [Blastocystis sp. Blastoise]